MATSAFLRNVPVLHDRSEELLEQRATQVDELRVVAGKWIMHEGDEADIVYIVRSGRVDVLHEGPPETLLRTLKRGDVVGELALLRGGRRSASVRARRDTELLRLGRESFETLIRRAPSFAIGLTRAMGSQLAASRSPMVADQAAPRGVGLLEFHQLDAAREAGRAAALEALEHAPACLFGATPS
jgi:NTE family protein